MWAVIHRHETLGNRKVWLFDTQKEALSFTNNKESFICQNTGLWSRIDAIIHHPDRYHFDVLKVERMVEQ